MLVCSICFYVEFKNASEYITKYAMGFDGIQLSYSEKKKAKDVQIMNVDTDEEVSPRRKDNFEESENRRGKKFGRKQSVAAQ